jgi:hypothetical protein
MVNSLEEEEEEEEGWRQKSNLAYTLIFCTGFSPRLNYVPSLLDFLTLRTLDKLQKPRISEHMG